jgi:hypothetical protein
MRGLDPRLFGLNDALLFLPHPEERSVSKDGAKQGKCGASPFETAASRLPQGEALFQVLKARFCFLKRNASRSLHHRPD